MAPAPLPDGLGHRKGAASLELELLPALELPFPDLPFAEQQAFDRLQGLGGKPRLGILRLFELAPGGRPAAGAANRSVSGFRAGGVGLVAVGKRRDRRES